MFDETTGLSERRATTIVSAILFLEALWIFLYKYLPLDAGLWALQSELIHLHMTGNGHDAWKLIPYPAANIGGPLLSGFLAFLFSGEVTTRLLLTFGAIFLRGLGIVTLFRVLRVRDETIYFLVPVLVLSGIWFTGALPYLLGETVAVWVLAFFISQDRPQGYAFWFVSIGLFVVALFHALLFLLSVIVVLMVAAEQRRTVHLSQGWLSSPRAVMSVLIPGAVVVALAFFSREPVFALSSSNLLPGTPTGRLLFFITPAPNVLEATFKYGDIFHGLLTILFVLVLLACFGRAYLLAIEEVTWQSRAVRTAGYLLLILSFLGIFFSGFGLETNSWVIFAIVLILGGAYSRGPAVRRTPMDRVLWLGSILTLVLTVLLNGFSVNVGSTAAEEVLKTGRRLVTQERQTALEDEHIDSISVRFVIDSALAQNYASHSVGTFSYSETAPLYLYAEPDLLKKPWMYQPRGGMVRTHASPMQMISPAVPIQLGSADKYIDSTVRVLAVLPKQTIVSSAFGPYDLFLVENGGATISRGEAEYRLSIGKLQGGHPVELASLFR